MRILVSGGGTAGHIYPALTVAARLAAEGHEVTFVGTPDGLEARLVPEAGVSFHAVKSSGFDRGNPLTLLTSAVKVLASVGAALRVLRRVAPDVVVGFGGYVSLPIGVAATLKRVPLVLHEQNSVPGLANRILARWARAVAVTYPESADRLTRAGSVVVTGNPVRDAVLEASRERGREALGVGDDAVVVLVFGGSRGARHINEAMRSLAPQLLREPRVQVIHVAGHAEYGDVVRALDDVLGADAGRYTVLDYVERMGDAIAASDVVVARAGATSIAEITAIGRASVLVPYPYATDDHQTGNARAVADAGGAIIVPDGELDTPRFAEAVLSLVSDAAARGRMAEAAARLGHRDATQRVASVVLGAVVPRKETR